MPISTSPASHPESAVEVLQWLINVRRIHESRGFQYIPAHDAIVLTLLSTGATFPWTPTCQLQFEHVNEEINSNSLSTALVPFVHAQRGSTSAVTPATTEPHQASTPLAVDPPRRGRHGPLRRLRGQRASSSVPAQLTLARASPPSRLKRSRVGSTSQRLLQSGLHLNGVDVNEPQIPRRPSQRPQASPPRTVEPPEASSLRTLEPATGALHPPSQLEAWPYMLSADNPILLTESEDDKCHCRERYYAYD